MGATGRLPLQQQRRGRGPRLPGRLLSRGEHARGDGGQHAAGGEQQRSGRLLPVHSDLAEQSLSAGDHGPDVPQHLRRGRGRRRWWLPRRGRGGGGARRQCDIGEVRNGHALRPAAHSVVQSGRIAGVDAQRGRRQLPPRTESQSRVQLLLHAGQAPPQALQPELTHPAAAPPAAAGRQWLPPFGQQQRGQQRPQHQWQVQLGQPGPESESVPAQCHVTEEGAAETGGGDVTGLRDP